MQDRYVGDIGDYLKLAMLRAIEPEHRLGVAWWLTPDEGPAGNGRHTTYLANPCRWRHLDPVLFDRLGQIIGQNDRKVASLESSELLRGTRFVSDPVPINLSGRQAWLKEMRTNFESCDVIFFDPDNGLEPATFRLGTKEARRSIAISELQYFRRQGRTLIVYHHQTRALGGHVQEIRSWCSRLGSSFERVHALRCRPFSPRVYFLLDTSDVITQRVHRLAERWGDAMVLNPHIIDSAQA